MKLKQSSKLVFLLALSAILALCFLVNFAHGQQQPDANDANESTVTEPTNETGVARNELVLPKIFDFERFKSVFNKKYSSFIEELARKKIFLGRAFRAFLSFVGYKHYRNDYYLKVNEMSDWTEAEHKAILKRRPLAGLKNKVEIVTTRDSVAELTKTPVANLEDIHEKLREIVDDPAYVEVKNELAATQQHQHNKKLLLKRKNSKLSTSGRAHLSVDVLFGEPETEEEKEESIKEKTPPSNNPHYQVPELSSFGATSEEDSKAPMEKATIDLISNLPGANYVGAMLSSASDYLFGGVNEAKEVKPSGKVAVAEKKKVDNDEMFIDHRASGCFNIPKNQDQCGSCYIFSTTALYEWQYCHETGEKVAFSEQYPLDCGEKVNMEGCNGGQEFDVAKFYGSYGLELRKNYPYRHTSDICPYVPNVSSKSMGYIRVKASNKENGGMVGVKFDDLEEFLKEGPILMGLGVSDDFSDYAGGVFNGKGCKEDNGHSMLIVGSGRENGKDYWLFRNSYGKSWGLDGYWKLNKRATNCLLDDGLGYFLKGTKSKTIFDLKEETNPNYKPDYVKQRHSDLIHRRPIEHNPFTYIAPEDGDEAAVTPPSTRSRS